MTVHRDELAQYLDTLLRPEDFSDYAPNGLQIEGAPHITHLVTGVSANRALIDQAIAIGADAILVHHGFFWKGEPLTLTGYRGDRIMRMVRARLSLFAYHLPLDAHPTYGNNAQILRLLGAEAEGTFGQGQPALGRWGRLKEPTPRDELLTQLAEDLGQIPIAFSYGHERVQTVGVVTGGGARFFEDALAQKLDLFISGEPSEQSQGIAVECSGNFAAFGHHATERVGVRALGEHLSERFNLRTTFIDVPNVV